MFDPVKDIAEVSVMTSVIKSIFVLAFQEFTAFSAVLEFSETSVTLLSLKILNFFVFASLSTYKLSLVDTSNLTFLVLTTAS